MNAHGKITLPEPVVKALCSYVSRGLSPFPAAYETCESGVVSLLTEGGAPLARWTPPSGQLSRPKLRATALARPRILIEIASRTAPKS